MSVICFSVSHSQAAMGAVSHLYIVEWRRSIPVQRRLSLTHVGLRKVIPGGVELVESGSASLPFHAPSVVRPECCTGVCFNKIT